MEDPSAFIEVYKREQGADTADRGPGAGRGKQGPTMAIGTAAKRWRA